MNVFLEITEAIKNALYKANNSLTIHMNDIKYTSFPFVLVKLNSIKINTLAKKAKKHFIMEFELLYRKSQENKVFELFEFQHVLENALLPVINVMNVKITVDNPTFSILEKGLIMNFELNFYAEEEDVEETMQLLDITLKGE